MKDFGLYIIITEPICSPEQIAQICVDKKIKMLQLREKNLNDKQLLSLAMSLREITCGTDTKFIVNDRVDIALLSQADGVHLGQDDVSYEHARGLLGDDKIIGLSTHSLAQAREALTKKPDYIGFGPIHATPTKLIADPVVGLDLLGEVLSFADVPVVAIGGITLENACDVMAKGAKNICAVRPFMQTMDVAGEIDKFLDVF